MWRNERSRFVIAALFLAVGLVLPLLTAQVKEIGDSLLPMHLPVMLCGLVCGWPYGAGVGLVLPFLRGLLFGMPPLYPNAVWMAGEMATYGLVTGLVYGRRTKSIGRLYIALVTAMLAGRVVWGLLKALLLGLGGRAFPFAAFVTGGFVDALPGIVLQLVLVPLLTGLIQRAKKQEGTL